MKERMKCIVRAINLSVPNKPKQIQKLVSAELVESCPHFEHGSSSYWTPKPVNIKICTRKDMERICPPKICVCPSKPKPRTRNQIFFQMVGFILKSAIVSTLFYWMYTDGTLPFFPDIDKVNTRSILRGCCFIRIIINIPRLENARYSLVQKYNRAVFRIMNVLVEIPQKAHRKLSTVLFRQEKTSEETIENDYTDKG
ncbi:PREDICTED: uncharacterized protein LOC106787096 [Polistes canadensis]|uniref:uncharacterized protein LOC106787096 n=1 Tax=Polistes canadensis TaxID=91411 RepID=UPI000718CC5A|nr:PREDICTED: uncharacterized protein LOC106787096 [Polistes canadensis]